MEMETLVESLSPRDCVGARLLLLTSRQFGATDWVKGIREKVGKDLKEEVWNSSKENLTVLLTTETDLRQRCVTKHDFLWNSISEVW